MAIERDIRDLLYDHDCVIVPEWGGLLTHYRSARLDEVRQVIHPPGKDLSFNRNLVRNDGLLADRVAKREGLPFDQALELISREVGAWHQRLQRYGRVELPLIGIFHRDQEHNLQFDPDPRGEYLKDAHGLRPVTAMAVERTVEVPLTAVPVLDPVDDRGQGWRVAYTWAAAVVAGLLFTGAALWAYRMGGPETGQWSGFAPFGTRPGQTYVPATGPTHAPVVQAGRVSLPGTIVGVTEVPLVPEEGLMMHVTAVVDSTAVAMPKVEAPAVRARFHVIGGCFAQPENADKLLQELTAKGFPAIRLPKHGDLHPVAYGSYVDRSTAAEALAGIRGSGGNAWLLVR